VARDRRSFSWASAMKMTIAFIITLGEIM